jgi:glyoxylase-like metal-dependent hydrolase (beta-lactamase superfamily II)
LLELPLARLAVALTILSGARLASEELALLSASQCEGGRFPDHWISGGPDCPREGDLQVHEFNEDFFILRQSLCSDYEAPFLYLIFGERRALLLDTGSHPDFDLQARVERLVQDWKRRHGVGAYELVVAHTHAHADHIGGDAQFAGQPDTILVAPGLASNLRFFGFSSWPAEIQSFDLGNRVLDLIPIPGHEISSIAFYDRRTCILLTGDSLYPGRLYVFGAKTWGQWDVYRRSIRRLLEFTSNHPVQCILGCHIEMTMRPGVDFPFAATWHPNEHALELGLDHLELLDAQLAAAGSQIQVYTLRDFIIYPIN